MISWRFKINSLDAICKGKDAAREKTTGRRAHGTDGALDGVEIDIDAAIVDEAAAGAEFLSAAFALHRIGRNRHPSLAVKEA
jgi:hypothetical protein